MGDTLGMKIGSALLGIKEKADQHGVGFGAAIGGEAAGMGALAATRLLPGGNAVRSLFDLLPSKNLAASRAVQEGTAAAGGVVGGLIGGKRAEKTGGKTSAVARAANLATTAHKVGGVASKVARAARTVTKMRARVRKHFLDKPPASYDGSMMSMYRQAIPNLFGPRAWSQVSGTKFGGYIRSRLKAVAQKMDDAAEANGIDTTPADPGDVERARQSLQMKQQDAMEQQQQHELDVAQAQNPPKPGAGGASPSSGSPFGKMSPRPLMRAPNDAVSANAFKTGGAANWDFLRRMQESDRKSAQVSLTRALAQPKIENLARAPSEDEQMYRDRIQRVMAASVAATNRLRPQLFNGGASQAGLSGLPGDAQAARYSVRKVPKSDTLGKDGWSIQSEIAKEFNTEDSLKHGLVYGWASIIEKDGKIVTDHEGDRIEPDDLMLAAHDFIKNSRNGGVLHDEHGHHIGHIVESVVFTKQLQKALNIDLKKVGWLIGYKITDPRVKMLVKGGLLKSFSIGGKGRRVPVEE
ncbi:MAG: XkdF-like putative serine protease domain-containing protein [Tepidisphaerales bacterium]